MGKIAPVYTKYIMYASIEADGVVEKPDVIGAIFGQTEGLLGEGLELRELQKSGKIGRIEVDLEVDQGKTTGTITIPSSLDKAQTALLGAAIETIERVGPSEAKIEIEEIEDVRKRKRDFLMSRAQDLLKTMMSETDTKELSQEVRSSVRQQEIREFGKDKLPAGPEVETSNEVIIVEGRADVLNLLKYGINNAISMNGIGVPKTIIDLCKEKEATIFIDGDHGGELIVKSLVDVANVQYVTKAPDGKEVEELTGKEIHKALRSKKEVRSKRVRRTTTKESTDRVSRKPKIAAALSKNFKKMLGELEGSKGAYILDEKLKILGRVPVDALKTTLKDLKEAYAIVFDGKITDSLMNQAHKYSVQYVVGIEGKAKSKKGIIYLIKEDL